MAATRITRIVQDESINETLRLKRPEYTQTIEARTGRPLTVVRKSLGSPRNSAGKPREPSPQQNTNAIEVPPKPGKSDMLQFEAKTLKVTLVLPAAQLVSIKTSGPAAPVPFVITVGERRVTGQFNSKSLRKTAAVIAEHGPEQVAVIVQGALVDGRIEAAGISAHVKGVKPASPGPAVIPV
jgi:hypothetical protein